MRKKRYIYGIILGLTLVTITGCSSRKDGTGMASPEGKQEFTGDEKQEEKAAVMDEFNKLIQDENLSLKEIAVFMKENIANTSKEEASEMILGFEQLQTERTAAQEEKYYDQDVQKKLNTLGSQGVNVNEPDSIKDESIRNLVTESRENGFKIETAEGSYFPIIDYSFYEQFSTYATPDIKEYINIMTVESENVFAKDAALVISWEEVVNRSISMERYLDEYPDSKKAEDIKGLYDNYVVITLYGLNNTPLFDYESRKMDNKAKAAYRSAFLQSSNSQYYKMLVNFMTIAKESNYILTDEVESFRKENTESNEKEENKRDKDPDRYSVAGIDDPDEFDKTFDLIKNALKDNDKDMFADYVAYPIKVNIDGERTDVKNKEEFIKKFDIIISEDLKNKFLNQKVEDLFVNQYGIMVGDGEFWMSEITGTKYQFSIYAINN